MKKIINSSIVVLLTLGFVIPVLANDEFDTNRDYYIELCAKPASELSQDEKNTCSQFMDYLSNESAGLKDELDELEKQREEIAKDILKYTEKIKGYDKRINALGEEIKEINDEILVKEAEIKLTEEQIQEKEENISELREQIKNRMVASQSSMRLNRYFDILMGAKDLNDLVRKSNGLNDIAKYDENSRLELLELIQQLGIEKEELSAAKQELETSKSVVKAKQDEVVVLRAEANLIREEYLRQEADLEATGNRIASDYEKIRDVVQSISENLNKIPNSSGFTRPIVNGVKTEGTWYYSSGGVHLGIDYGRVPLGTSIRAAGNGYVLKSVDGCPYGGLGNTCGSAQGGSTGGGNQVYLLTNVKGTLYAVKYVHLLAGSPIAQGSIVSAGDKIAEQGSSGNSSGPHVHVEIIKLGTMSITEYVKEWNGDLSFGAGWGASALNRTCDKSSAPCRIRPETVFE